MRTTAMPRRQRGFTLTELMVVVSIIGILVTMAIVYMRPKVRPIDAATRVGDLVREASRRAVALGAVRSDVVTALVSKARTQILVSTTPNGLMFTLYRLQEDPTVGSGLATWVPVENYVVHSNVLPVKWAKTVGDRTMAGQVATWDSPAPPAPATGLVIQCKPDGTCTPVTMFFQASTVGPDCLTAPVGPPLNDQCAKLSVMPLGGAITTRPDWN